MLLLNKVKFHLRRSAEVWYHQGGLPSALPTAQRWRLGCSRGLLEPRYQRPWFGPLFVPCFCMLHLSHPVFKPTKKTCLGKDMNIKRPFIDKNPLDCFVWGPFFELSPYKKMFFMSTHLRLGRQAWSTPRVCETTFAKRGAWICRMWTSSMPPLSRRKNGQSRRLVEKTWRKWDENRERLKISQDSVHVSFDSFYCILYSNRKCFGAGLL